MWVIKNRSNSIFEVCYVMMECYVTLWWITTLIDHYLCHSFLLRERPVLHSPTVGRRANLRGVWGDAGIKGRLLFWLVKSWALMVQSFTGECQCCLPALSHINADIWVCGLFPQQYYCEQWWDVRYDWGIVRVKLYNKTLAYLHSHPNFWKWSRETFLL